MMDVLRCLEPEGELPARSIFPVHFIFSPLEARVYSVGSLLLRDQMSVVTVLLAMSGLQVCLPIRFSDGTSVIVTFKGEGVTADDMSTFLPERRQSGIPNRSLVLLPEQVGTMTAGHTHCVPMAFPLSIHSLMKSLFLLLSSCL